MNLIDCVVTKILSDPYEQYGAWWVKIDYNSYGRISEGVEMFKTEAQAKAKAFKVGDWMLK